MKIVLDCHRYSHLLAVCSQTRNTEHWGFSRRLVFIRAQSCTTVSCNSLLKHHTLQLLATISQNRHLCSCVDWPHKTAPVLALSDS